jgi:hypothetical protein
MSKKEESKKDFKDKKESIEDGLIKAKTENHFDIDSIMGIMDDEIENNFKPVNSLEQIKTKLTEKKKVVDEDTGEDILVPLYTEEEKVRAMFSLLSEKSLNLLDFIEGELENSGYDGKKIFAINETMDRVSNTLRDISEIQYRKAKLENEKVHLEIQKYKADLKKKELDIKEKSVENKLPNTTNIVAVGSQAELMKLISDKRDEVMDGESLED